MLERSMGFDEALFWKGLKMECPLLNQAIRELNIKGRLPVFHVLKLVCDKYGIDRPTDDEAIIVTLNRIEAELRRRLV